MQKGLVLLINGLEVVEEGAGFGVPIAKYSDTTYFSRNATVYVEEQNQIFKKIKKVFLIDSVSKKQVHGASINDSLYSVFHAAFEKAYIHRGKMRSVFDWIMRLRKTIGVETHFADAPPHGQVTVTYHCYPDQIRVTADFSKLDATNCREILLLNEQGATFFSRFRNGNKVSEGTEIGAWTRVEARRGEYSDAGERILFSIEKREGATLYCGWEQVKDRFSWAGMTFSLSPKTSTFTYAIQLRENST